MRGAKSIPDKCFFQIPPPCSGTHFGRGCFLGEAINPACQIRISMAMDGKLAMRFANAAGDGRRFPVWRWVLPTAAHDWNVCRFFRFDMETDPNYA